MAWNMTMLSIHLLAALACGFLYRLAPCWTQKIVIGLLVMGMLVFAGGDAFASRGWIFEQYYMRMTGAALEHIAVLLYVFRLVYQESTWATSLEPSRSSPR